MPITPVSRRSSTNDDAVRRGVQNGQSTSQITNVAKGSMKSVVEGAKAKSATKPPCANITRVRASFQQEAVDLAKLRHHSDPDGPTFPVVEARGGSIDDAGFDEGPGEAQEATCGTSGNFG